MANRDIIARMNDILDEYEAGRMRPLDVERGIQFLMDALEALPYARVKDADMLCHRLVTAHMFDGEDEFIGEEDLAKVMADFRMFLASLPSGTA